MNILISGGTAGLGRELALQLARGGHQVYVFSRSAVSEPEAERGIVRLQADVTDPHSLQGLKDDLAARGVRIDAVINNAGRTEIGSPYSKPYLGHHWRDILATNIEGPLNMLDVFLDQLLASKQALVVNISSVLAYYPSGFFSVYAASKAFVSALSRALGGIEAGFGIRVVDVVLPMLDTEMSRDIQLQGIGKMSPVTAAEQIIQGIESGKNEIRVGDARLLMRLRRIIPKLIQKNFDGMSNSYIKVSSQGGA